MTSLSNGHFVPYPVDSHKDNSIGFGHSRASLEANKKVLVLQWNDEDDLMKFPLIWLRDNCLCEDCFHNDSLSRKPHRWARFDTNVDVDLIAINDRARQLEIQWFDGHVSRFPLSWLEERNFDDRRQNEHIRTWYRAEPQLWQKNNFEKILKYYNYCDVMEKDSALLEWLDAITVYGVAMLKNAPTSTGVVKALADRVGFIRKTTYGEEFSVKSRPGAKNYSYLSEPLPLHTDMPYFEYLPSITLLHTFEQSESSGGWNTLVDGFSVAEQIKQQRPCYFKSLSSTLVDWCDIGSDGGLAFHNVLRAPVICLDQDGKYARINHSIPQRDSHFNVSIDAALAWYEANAHFVNLAQEEAVTFKMERGDVLTFNNLRMLHGRTGYKDTTNNVRHIIGGFVDWDIAYSKMRVLRRDRISN